MDRTIVDFLHATIRARGSDLHLSVGLPPSVRVDGEIKRMQFNNLTDEDVDELVMSVLSDSQRAKLEENLELDFALGIDSVGRFRGNVHYNRGAMEAVFRHIQDEIPELEDLGHKRAIEKLCHLKEGLVLVTGITGSGKSSTLASMMKRIAESRKGVLITVEDPIEFILEHGSSVVKQREVGIDTHSFANALKHALRQDPDVIMVSELRDLETIQAAVTAAETGHLVLGTLHTIDAPKTLDRMIDAFPADQQSQIIAQLANCLKAVVSQKLLKKKSGKGRVLAEELMLMNQSIRTCLRERKFEQIQGLIEIAQKEGMFTIDHHLVELMKADKISVDVAYNACRDETLLNKYIETKKLTHEPKATTKHHKSRPKTTELIKLPQPE